METQELTLHNELKRKSIFLRDYTTELYASGATTIRIEKNLGRIAEQWHTKADFSVLPTCIVLNLWDENEEKSYTVTGKIPADRINFNTVSDLSSLSWKVVEEDLDVCKATARFRDVLEKKRLNPWLVLVLVGLANASFCELFGGDLVSMLIVFIATIDGFFLKQKLPGLLMLENPIAAIAAKIPSFMIRKKSSITEIEYSKARKRCKVPETGRP